MSLIAATLMLALAGDAPPANLEPLGVQAIRAVSQCISSGGAEHFTLPNGVVSAPPPGIAVPTGTTVTFWRVTTDQGALFAYSGYEGRTDFCGIVASGVDLKELGEELARVPAAHEYWAPASPPALNWARSGVQSERYWGDTRNTSLYGAALVTMRPVGSGLVLQLHYHATKVF
jgi:hypothetical protein